MATSTRITPQGCGLQTYQVKSGSRRGYSFGIRHYNNKEPTEHLVNSVQLNTTAFGLFWHMQLRPQREARCGGLWFLGFRLFRGTQAPEGENRIAFECNCLSFRSGTPSILVIALLFLFLMYIKICKNTSLQVQPQTIHQLLQSQYKSLRHTENNPWSKTHLKHCTQALNHWLKFHATQKKSTLVQRLYKLQCGGGHSTGATLG